LRKNRALAIIQPGSISDSDLMEQKNLARQPVACMLAREQAAQI
jgi:hypothetical protein